MGREIIAHRHHAALLETVLLVEGTGTFLKLVGQERDALEVFSPCIPERVLQETAPIALATVILVDHQILQDKHKSALCRTDGDEQVDHSDDPGLVTHYEDPAPVGLLQNQPQASHLLIPVRNKIILLGKKIKEQVRQLGQIVGRSRFDEKLLGHLGGIMRDEVLSMKSEIGIWVVPLLPKH